jgi:O-antigen/teichoic acid export membrane protein
VTTLRQQTVRATFWSAGSRSGQQLVQFAGTVVLARLLVPSDFGLVAMIAVFSGFAQLFVDFGLASAIVQRQELNDRHLSTAFWMNLVAGFTLTLVVAGASPGIAALYDEPDLVPLTLLVSLNFVLAAPIIVQNALLVRAMNFKRIAAIEIGAALCGAGAAVVGAALGMGAFALIVQILTTTLVRTIVLWLLTDWRPTATWDRQAMRELWGFGANLAGFQAVTYWSRSADNLLVGRFVGAAGLGIYNRAYSTMLLPVNQVTSVIGRVMFPALSRIQDDLPRVRRGYLRAVGLISLATFPLVIGLIVVAEPFVLTLYGSQWKEAVPILQILCVAMLVQTVAGTTGWLYQSQGRTDWMFRWGVASTVVTVVAFAIGIHWGIQGVAIAYVVRTFALAYFSFAIPGRLIGLRFRDVARAVWEVLAISLVMGTLVWLTGDLLPATWPAGAVLLIQVATGILVYVSLARLLLLSPYRDLRTIVADFRPRRAKELAA